MKRKWAWFLAVMLFVGTPINVLAGNERVAEIETQEIKTVENDVGIVASGSCGKNATWELDDLGTLTIGGSGTMTNLANYSSTAPWSDYIDDITNVVIESGITNIGSYIFYNCTNLKSVSISEGVTQIGYCAFEYCSSLKDIVIPEGVTTIQYDAFYGCSSLENVVLPDSLTSLGDIAFAYCSSLVSIAIPEKVTSLGKYMFLGCSSLERIDIPVSVVQIANGAFQDCTGLTDVYYGGSEEEWNAISIEMKNNDCLTSAIIHYGTGTLEMAVSKYVEDTGEYTQNFSQLLVGDTVRFSVDVTVDMDTSLSFSKSDWSYSGGEDDGMESIAFGMVTVIGPETSESDEGKQIYHVSITGVLKAAGNYIVNFDSPAEGSAKAEVVVEDTETSFCFGAALYTNVNYCLVDDTVVLYGQIGSSAETFDVDNAIESVAWEISNPAAAEIVSFETDGYDFINESNYRWILTVHALKAGIVTFTGTTMDGSTAEYDLVIDPKMIFDAPDEVSNTAEDTQKITCTVKLDEADAEYLEAFMEGLSYEIDSAIMVDLLVEDEEYTVADDACSAVYTLYVTAESKISGVYGTKKNNVEVTFTSAGGQVCADSVTAVYNRYYRPEVDGWSWKHETYIVYSADGELPYIMSRDLFNLLFEDTWQNTLNYNKIKTIIKSNDTADGLCNGLALSTALIYQGLPDISAWDEAARTAHGMSVAKLHQESEEFGLELHEFIEVVHASQFLPEITEQDKEHKNKYASLIQAVSNFEETGENPVAITVSSISGAHVLIGYRAEKSDSQILVYVYDCNYPDEERYIMFSCDGNGNPTGWSYTLFDEDNEVWKSSSLGSSITYEDDLSIIYDKIVSGTGASAALVSEDEREEVYTSANVSENDSALVVSTSDSFTVTTADGSIVTSVNGTFTGEEDTELVPIIQKNYLSGADFSFEDARFYYGGDDSLIFRNDSDAEEVSLTIADDVSDVNILSDGQSTVSLGEAGGQFEVSVTPVDADSAVLAYTTDDGKMVIAVEGKIDGVMQASVVSGSSELTVTGCESGTVTATCGGVTSLVEFVLSEEEASFTVSVQEDSGLTVTPNTGTTDADTDAGVGNNGNAGADNAISGTDSYASSVSGIKSVGETLESGGMIYQITALSGSSGTVACIAPADKTLKSVIIPATVTISGKTYKVTSVAKNAFKGNKKLKSVVIGKNVESIGANAFKGCTLLKKITIKSSKLKQIGKNAIKGISKKAVIKTPKKSLKAYKKLFSKKTGYKKTMKIKK